MNMKKLFAIIMILTLTASIFTACGNSGGNDADTSSTKESESIEASTEETSTETLASEESVAEEVDPYEGLTFYESEKGISLYMSEGFSENEVEGVLLSYNGPNSGVSCQQELFSALETVGYNGAEMTLEEYGQLILGAYQLDGEVLTDEYGNTYIRYLQDIQGTSIVYYGYFNKGSESFWITNFMCIAAEEEKFAKDFPLWASSIQVQ